MGHVLVQVRIKPSVELARVRLLQFDATLSTSLQVFVDGSVKLQ